MDDLNRTMSWTLSCLPVDLFYHICSFLYIQEHLQLSSISSSLRAVSSHPRSWQTLVSLYDRHIPLHFFRQQDLSFLQIVVWPPITPMADANFLRGKVYIRHLDLSDVTLSADMHFSSVSRTCETLNLRNTKMKDHLCLSRLQNVTMLNLSDNRSLHAISHLSVLTTLKSLNLSNTSVRDISALSTLTTLQDLMCGRTQVKDISILSSLTALQSLWLYDTPVEDISAISTLTLLHQLGLTGTQVTDISPLSTLTALHTLWLSHTRVTDISPLSHLVALQDLWLNNTSISDISPLSTLVSLRELSIEHTQVTSIYALSTLTVLQDLLLYNTRVTDTSCLSHVMIHR